MINHAIFLDRDGVLLNNQDYWYIFKTEDYRLNEGVCEGLRLLINRGYLLIVISNQGGISKGIYTKLDTDLIHHKLEGDLKNAGIKITAWYYCPHHPDSEKCLCRKPSSLMIEKALARFSIDKGKSFFIGDSISDMEAAKGAGVIPVKVEPNQGFEMTCRKLAGLKN